MSLTIDSCRKHVIAAQPRDEVWIWKQYDCQRELLFKPGENERVLSDPGTAHGARSVVGIIWDILKALTILVVAMLIILAVMIPLGVLQSMGLLGSGLIDSFIKLTAGRVVRLLGMRTMSGLQNYLDPRRPILFLRAHADDGLRVEKDFNFKEPDWRDPLKMQSQISFEEVIATTISRWGPLVSLRLPSERSGAFHFRRYTVPYGAWQKQILYWMNQSSLIVLIVPPSEKLADSRFGVAWEIATLAKMRLAEKLMVILPPSNAAEILARWKSFCQLATELGITGMQDNLPAPPPVLAHFSQDWHCRFVAGKGTKPSDYVAAIRRTVRDLNERRWRTYQAGIMSIVLSIPFVCIGVLAWYLGLLDTPRNANVAIGATCIAAAVGGLTGYFGRLW